MHKLTKAALAATVLFAAPAAAHREGPAPGDLAAAAGTDESEATLFLDDLTAQGQCEYSDKVIRFLQPNHKDPKKKELARS